MIYLIKSAAFKNNTDDDEYETVLKIGYTKEDGMKSRFDAYITENPTMKVLFLIPEGTEQDEKNLHNYFKDYLKYGNEWFSYDPKILEFFKTHTTKESLQELDTYISKNRQKVLLKEHKEFVDKNTLKYINRVIYYLGFNRKLLKNLYNIVDNNTQDFIDNYFTTTYPDIDFTESRTIDNELANIIDNIDNLDKFWEKMRYIYNLNMSEELAKRLFDNLIDTSFAKYYYSISKEFASKCGYSKKAMDKEFNRLNSIISTINDSDIPEEIYNSFLVGSRYSKAYIKEKLKEIYDNLGYSKTAKASDLGEYFELKVCNISSGDGKYDKGFEIIKKKGIDQ